jgi:hypothetical protein
VTFSASQYLLFEVRGTAWIVVVGIVPNDNGGSGDEVLQEAESLDS